MRPKFTMREALEDNNLLGQGMKGDSWLPCRCLLIASRGERLSTEERRVLYKFTQRGRLPRSPVDELWIIAGRRGGKSRSESVLAAYYGGLCEYPNLAPGETLVVLVIAPDTTQAAIILEYTSAIFDNSPLLRPLVKNKTGDALELTNGISIEVRAASFRRLRGPTYAAVIVDEAAFFYSDNSANPDAEILNAVRPGLATTGGPLIVASSPYAKRGELWNAFHGNFGDKGDKHILVVQGASRDFNASLSKRVVDRAYAKDPASADAEFGGNFRSDIEAFLSREAVDACVNAGSRELPRTSGVRYFGFVDPSGGSKDSFSLAIGHRNGTSAVIDVLRDVKPPFSPKTVAKDFATLLREYGVASVNGDHYAGLWPRERFADNGIVYNAHSKPKSELYLSLLSNINSQTVELLDNTKLVTQLVSLERRTSRGGRDTIDHPPKGHDDLANVVAGVVHEIMHGVSARQTGAFIPPIIISGAETSGTDEFRTAI